MTFDTAKQSVDYILANSDLFDEDSVSFEFIGGEPCLEMDLIDKISDYIKKEMFRLDHKWFNHYMFGFTTNGLNYHSEKVQKYIEKNKKHLSITITLDGTKAKHDINRIYKNSGKGSYEDIVKNIPQWLKQFPHASTKVTISSEDLPYIKESVLHLFGLGIKTVHINCVFEDVWKEGDDIIFEQQLTELADQILDQGYYDGYECSLFAEHIGKPMSLEKDNNWCGAGKMLSIDAAGNFYPCTRFAQYSLREKRTRIIGNVNDGIDTNLLRPFLTLRRSLQSSQKCMECEISSGCAWCQGENYDTAETPTVYQRATAICKMHKARVRANNYYWNKLYHKLEMEGKREEFESIKSKSKDNIIC